MRIIAGCHRGRRILPPSDRKTRPMLERVREALFATLGEQVEGATVLDLFSGTGSLGLEALSRGARRVLFVERGREARERLMRNIAELGLGERAEVSGRDALRASSWSFTSGSATEEEGARGGGRAELIFMDPPYPFWHDRRLRSRSLQAIEALYARVLAPSGLLVLHTAPRDLEAQELPGLPAGRRYGRSQLWYLQS